MVRTLVFLLFVTSIVFASRPFLIKATTEAFVSVDPITSVECGSNRILVKNTTCLDVPQLYQLSVTNPLPPGYRLLNLSAIITSAVNGNASFETKLIDISGKTIQELVISDDGKQPFQCQSIGYMTLPSNYSDSWTSNWIYYKNSANTLTLYINTTEPDNNKIHFKSPELCVSKISLLLYGSDVDPKVTKIEPAQIPVGLKSSYITVYANNLIVGSDYFCSFYLTATRSIETVTITVSQPTNQVRCDIPDHVTDNVGSVTFRLFPDLRYGIFSADAIKMTIFPLPLVTKIEPASGPAGGGNNVTMIGENFFENATLTVSFGEIGVIAKYIDINTIVCTPPKYSQLSGGVLVGKDVSVPISISEDGIHMSSMNVDYLYLDVPPDLWPNTPQPSPEPYDFLEFLRENLWVVIVSGALVLVGIFVITSFVVKNCRKKNETFSYQLLQTELPHIDLPKCIIDPKELKLKERIGSGRYADVYRATWRKTDVAVKKLPENRDMYLIKQLFKEINVMINLRHPNVITFMGATVNPASNLSIVTEYLSRGSLFSIIHDPNILLECEHIRKMSADCARGMNYLHKGRIIHRDLKTTNLLVDENWNIKVADFGLSKFIDGKQSSSSFSSVGSPAYSSPEVLKSQSYSFKSDVYSFAIVLLEFCTRTIPFKGMAPYNIVLEVATKNFRPEIPEEAEVPEDFSQMIRECWETDPNKRPTFEELLDALESFAFESQYVFPVELSEKYRFTRDTVDSSVSSSTYTNKNTQTAKLMSLLKGSSNESSSDGDGKENAETAGSEFSSFYYEESNPSYKRQTTSYPSRIQNKKKSSSLDLLTDS